MWDTHPHGVERAAFIGDGTFGAVGVDDRGSSVRRWNKEKQ